MRRKAFFPQCLVLCHKLMPIPLRSDMTHPYLLINQSDSPSGLLTILFWTSLSRAFFCKKGWGLHEMISTACPLLREGIRGRHLPLPKLAGNRSREETLPGSHFRDHLAFSISNQMWTLKVAAELIPESVFTKTRIWLTWSKGASCPLKELGTGIAANANCVLFCPPKRLKAFFLTLNASVLTTNLREVAKY